MTSPFTHEQVEEVCNLIAAMVDRLTYSGTDDQHNYDVFSQRIKRAREKLMQPSSGQSGSVDYVRPHQFNIGDKVRVVKPADFDQNAYHVQWTSEMDNMNGNLFPIKDFGQGGRIKIFNDNGDYFWFLPSWLELVDDIEPESNNEGWIKWGGGKCPVKKGTLVDIKYRDGTLYSKLRALVDINASDAYWQRDSFDNDIAAYRLSKPAPNQHPYNPDTHFLVPKSLTDEEAISIGKHLLNYHQVKVPAVDILKSMHTTIKEFFGDK